MARVLVIGDTHCPAMIDGYVDFLKSVKETWDTDTTVHIGDVVDFAAISFHEKNPSLPSVGDEMKIARRQVEELYSAFPDATVMTGNHDDLPRRQATAAGIPEEIMRDPSSIWGTPGWEWMNRFSIIAIDGVHYAHGDRGKGGQNAALKNAKESFCPWVQGHQHSQAGVTWFANRSSLIFGMSVGCGIDRHAASMHYGIKFSSKPIIGCGVVLDGEFAVFEPMRVL